MEEMIIWKSSNLDVIGDTKSTNAEMINQSVKWLKWDNNFDNKLIVKVIPQAKMPRMFWF